MAYRQGWARYSKISIEILDTWIWSIEILDTRYLALEYRDTRYSILGFEISQYKILDTQYILIKLDTGFLKIMFIIVGMATSLSN